MRADLVLGCLLVPSSIWLVCCSRPFKQQHAVALTFDDLPAADTTDGADAESINRAILDSLARRHAPATAFVIEKRVHEIGDIPGREILSQWVQRGHDLGNHSFSHADFNQITIEQMKREIVLGGNSITEVLGKLGRAPRHFRFPMNHTGDTRAKHDAISVFLAQHGYNAAPSTIENEDFIFNTAYLRMLERKDDGSATRLRSDYLAYTSTEIDYYRALNMQVLGYEPPQIMVLHANHLNADVLDAVLRLLEEKEYTFITLDKAQANPAFQTPDTFISLYGPMSGYRWAAERGVKVNGHLEAEPPAWILEYGKQ